MSLPEPPPLGHCQKPTLIKAEGFRAGENLNPLGASNPFGKRPAHFKAGCRSARLRIRNRVNPVSEMPTQLRLPIDQQHVFPQLGVAESRNHAGRTPPHHRGRDVPVTDVVKVVMGRI